MIEEKGRERQDSHCFISLTSRLCNNEFRFYFLGFYFKLGEGKEGDKGERKKEAEFPLFHFCNK